MIELYCQHCGHQLKIPDKYAGQSGTCKNCGKQIVVPAVGFEPDLPSAPTRKTDDIPYKWIGATALVVAVFAVGLYSFVSRDDSSAASVASSEVVVARYPEATTPTADLPEPQAPIQPRTVTFPSDRVVGTLFMRDKGDPFWGRAVGPARGPVTVPEGQEIGLFINKDHPSDIAFLQAFEPNDIEFLILFIPSLTNGQLRNLEHLTGLKMLLVEYCGLTDEGLRSFQGLSQLEFVGVAGTKITDVGLSMLRGLTALKGLSLAGTMTTDRGVRSLMSSSALENLFMSASALTPSMVDVLKEIPTLRALYLDTDVVINGTFFPLSDGPVNPDSILLLKNVDQLDDLFFRGTLHDDSLIQPLSQLVFLTGIKFQNTSVTQVGKNKLRSALPNCTIKL